MFQYFENYLGEKFETPRCIGKNLVPWSSALGLIINQKLLGKPFNFFEPPSGKDCSESNTLRLAHGRAR